MVGRLGRFAAAWYGRTRSWALVATAFVSAFLLAAVLCSCAAPAVQEPDERGSFDFAEPVLDGAGSYGAGESIEVGGILAEGAARSEGDEVSIGYPSITKYRTLPDGISPDDFRGGTFDVSSAAAMEEIVGAAPDVNGALPEGFSYLMVEETMTNITDEALSYDVSTGQFATICESGSISYVGSVDPLWYDAWNGDNMKQYWLVPLEAGQELTIRLLYVLSDDAISSAGLSYVVDAGNAGGGEGFAGIKAFDVAGRVEEGAAQ